MSRKLALILVATLLLLSLACGGTTTEKLQTAVPTSEPAADESAAVDDTDPEDAGLSGPEPSATSAPTSTPKPTASPVEDVFDVVIAEQGFG